MRLGKKRDKKIATTKMSLMRRAAERLGIRVKDEMKVKMGAASLLLAILYFIRIVLMKKL